MDQKEPKTIVKVPLEPDKAAAFNTLAKERGISRADYCREVLIRYLEGREPGQDTGTAQGTKNQGSDPPGYLLERCHDLERERDRLVRELEALHVHHQAALDRIPVPLPERTEDKPSWWSRLFGRR